MPEDYYDKIYSQLIFSRGNMFEELGLSCLCFDSRGHLQRVEERAASSLDVGLMLFFDLDIPLLQIPVAFSDGVGRSICTTVIF